MSQGPRVSSRHRRRPSQSCFLFPHDLHSDSIAGNFDNSADVNNNSAPIASPIKLQDTPAAAEIKLPPPSVSVELAADRGLPGVGEADLDKQPRN